MKELTFLRLPRKAKFLQLYEDLHNNFSHLGPGIQEWTMQSL